MQSSHGLRIEEGIRTLKAGLSPSFFHFQFTTMNRLNIMLCLCLLTSAENHAQSVRGYLLEYEGVFNLKFDVGKQYHSYRSILIDQQDASTFFMIPSPVESLPNELLIESDTSFRVIKQTRTSRLVFGELSFTGKEIFYEDTLHPMQWELVDEVRLIDSFECRRADTWFRGRRYTAWYCPDLPLPNGPWKLGGLPGLIIEAKEAAGDMHFLLRSIRPYMYDPIDRLQLLQSHYQDYPAYIDHWKNLAKRMKGMAAAQPGTECLTCQTTPTLSLRKWEKIAL